VLRHAVEHEAARWANTPGIGRSGTARYIWETLQNHHDATRAAAKDHGYQWIADYLRDHPEVFDLPPIKSTLSERRKELSAEADQRALHAYQAGDIEGAVQALAEAEALHPNPGKHFADAIAAVRAAAATSGPAAASRDSAAIAEHVVGVHDGRDSGSPPKPGDSSMANNGLPASEEIPRRVRAAHPRPASSLHVAPHAADDAPSRCRVNGERQGLQRMGVAPDVA
jgi:hypothetical protein